MANDVVRAKPGETSMDRWVADSLIGWAAGKKCDDLTRARLSQEMKTYAAELAGPSPNPVESLLAETAALCWFTLRLHEAHFSGASSGEGMTLNQGRYHLTKIDRAHARLMSTLKTLASVRRLAVPSVQVNIARRQVNQQVIAPKSE